MLSMQLVWLIAVASAPLWSGAGGVGRSPDFCRPLVIAHRGASGYAPEHTLGAYALAATMGADYVEPDVVMTRDAQLVARHDNELGLSTDVAARAEFAARYRTQLVDGAPVSGWFTEDFTLQEIKTLRAVERIPDTRPGNARMDGAFQVLTLQEVVDLVKGLEASLGHVIGIYPEIKHPTHFANLGLAMERPLVDLLHRNGYTGPDAPVYIQSFEISSLRELKNMTELPLLQLFSSNPSLPPYDQFVQGSGVTYGGMATAAGLAAVAEYARAVGPDKSYVIPRNADQSLGEPTAFVADAHAVGLKVHPFTFRAESTYLPLNFRSNDTSPDALGDMEGEVLAFIAAGVDGVFTDQPDIPVGLREWCQKPAASFASGVTSVAFIVLSVVLCGTALR